MISFRSIQKHWNAFFFEKTSALPLGIYRMIFGLLAFWYALTLRPELNDFFGVDGMLTLTEQLGHTGLRLNLFQWLPASNTVVHVLWGLLVGASLFLTWGLFSRICAGIIFVLLVSFHHRNPLILNGGDVVLRVMSFLLVLAPAGKAFSLDRLIRILRGKADSAPELISAWPLRLLQLQFAWIYVATAHAKLGGALWSNGLALYYVLRLPEFHRHALPFVHDHLFAIRLLTWSTLVLEFALGLLIWIKELRLPLVFIGIVFHLGIEAIMVVPLFEWIMIAGLLLFIEAADWRKLASWFSVTVQEPVFYDGDCVFCLRWKNALESIDVRKAFCWVNFRNLSEKSLKEMKTSFDFKRAEDEMLLQTKSGKTLGGFDAFRHLLGRFLLTFWIVPFLYLPGVPRLGRRLYRWIAAHRYLFLGKICSAGSCSLPPPRK